MNAYDSGRFDVFYKDQQIGSIRHSRGSVVGYHFREEKSFSSSQDAMRWLKDRYVSQNRRQIEILRKRATTMLNNANRILAMLDALDQPAE